MIPVSEPPRDNSGVLFYVDCEGEGRKAGDNTCSFCYFWVLTHKLNQGLLEVQLCLDFAASTKKLDFSLTDFVLIKLF